MVCYFDFLSLSVYNANMKRINKKIYHFPVIIEKDESGYYIGKVPSLRSCYTQAKNLPELYKRLNEVVGLCLEVERDIFKTATVPIHRNENLSIGVLREILRDIELSIEDYERLRRKM